MEAEQGTQTAMFTSKVTGLGGQLGGSRIPCVWMKILPANLDVDGKIDIPSGLWRGVVVWARRKTVVVARLKRN